MLLTPSILVAILAGLACVLIVKKAAKPKPVPVKIKIKIESKLSDKK